MAELNQTIANSQTGQRMEFVELRPELLRIDSLNPPTPEREPTHVHPRQESGAEVISGALVFEVDGVERRLAAGESIAIPAGTPHRFWNPGEEDAHSVQFFRPALDIAAFFETYFELVRRGELNRKGELPLLRLAAMVPEFSDEIRPTSPPWPLVRAMTIVLGPVARRRGLEGRLAYRG
ncbi:MAG: cupin domain-containing protein [Solirubrobacterales bacterium]|nr:cupin domain-containing protein [Solirubrobacterales bacterium]